MRAPVGVPGRLLVSDLKGNTTTWLDRSNLLGATVQANLNLPWQITVDVRAGDPAVNTIYTDGDPLVAQSNRLVWVFLNEAPTNAMTDKRWRCRASGILMSPQDQGDADIGTTHFTAYDPWQYMMGLPCFLDGIGHHIGPGGRFFPFTRGNVIAYSLVQDTISSLLALGYPLSTTGVFADVPPAYGGTTHWTGTNEATPALNFLVQQGTSLGQALAQLCTAGSDVEGTNQCIDIVFEPIYDVVDGSGHPTRPGYVSQMSVYDLAGVERPGAPMAWSRFTRSATTADRQHDGTPGAFVNVAQYMPGQGTDSDLYPPFTNFSSLSKYYPYWEQRWFPGQFNATVVKNMAIQTLALRKQGKRTFAVDPDPLRAGMPFRDYTVGDRIPVYTPGVSSGRATGLRVAEAGYERVETIPLVVGADGVTRVSQLLVSPDWPKDDGSTGSGGGGGGDLAADLPPRLPASIGTNYYVDPVHGNDANSGSFASPWRTMPHAIATKGTEPGAGIGVIGNGIVLNSQVGGPYAIDCSGVINNVSNPLTIFAVTPYGVTIESAGGHGGGFTIGALFYQAQGIRLLGFVFTVGGGGPPGSTPVHIEDCKRIEVNRNRLVDNGGQPLIRGGSGHPSEDIWWIANDHGINGVDTSGGYYDVRGTHQLYDGQEAGSYSGTVLSGSLRTVVANNLFRATVPGYGCQHGPQSDTAFNVNNTYYAIQPASYLAGDCVVLFDQGGTYMTRNCKVKNNIGQGCHGSLAAGPSGGPEVGNVVENNLAYNNDCSWANSQGFPAGTEYPTTNVFGGPVMYSIGPLGNLPSADPKFTNPGGLDFSLQAGSPALGASEPAYTPLTDFFELVRSGSAPSLGAVEA